MWLISQEYRSVPKIITRNINYFILNKINDAISIDNIIRNHNMWDIARFIAHEHYMLSPFIDNKETDRRRFFPLPLDEEEEVKFINQKLTEHECSELGRIFGHKIEL